MAGKARIASLAVVGLALSVGSAIGGPARTAAAAPTGSALIPGGSLRTVAPHRLVDTRSGLGAPRGAATQLTVVAGGHGGVPATGVSAVAVHITVTEPAGSGYLTLYRAGTSRPGTSNLNFAEGQNVTGMVLAPVDTGGRFVVYASVRTQLIVDVEGYFTDPARASGGGLYRPVTPERLLDTRSSQPLGSQAVRSVRVTGIDGIPSSSVSAVIVNLTAVAPSASGHLVAYPAGAARPATTTVSLARGQVVADRAVVAVGRGGAIDVYNSAGTVNLLVDVTGYFTTDGSGSYYVPVDPVRAFNGRSDNGWVTGSVQQMTGAGQIPQASGIVRPTATVFTLTAVAPQGSGYISTQPNQLPEHPGTSDLNYDRHAVANLDIDSVGLAGFTGVAVHGATATFIIDEYGYFAAPLAEPPPGAWAWGDDSRNSYYLLGEFAEGSQTLTTPVAGPPGAVVSATAVENVGIDLLSGGQLQTWSETDTPRHNNEAAITPTTELTGVSSVAASNEIALALKSDGTVWERVASNQWAQRAGVASAIAVASEETHYSEHVGYAVLSDHTVVELTEGCGGGMGCDPRYLYAAKPVTGLSDVTALAGGYDAMYAVRSDGTVWAWGDDSQHQLGDGATTSDSTPQLVPGLSNVVQVAGGGFNDTYALESDGTVWRWGSDAPTPEQVTVPAQIVAIAPDQQGGDVTARLSDGTVWAWQRDTNTFGPVPYLNGESGATCGQYLCFAWH